MSHYGFTFHDLPDLPLPIKQKTRDDCVDCAIEFVSSEKGKRLENTMLAMMTTPSFFGFNWMWKSMGMDKFLARASGDLLAKGIRNTIATSQKEIFSHLSNDNWAIVGIKTSAKPIRSEFFEIDGDSERSFETALIPTTKSYGRQGEGHAVIALGLIPLRTGEKVVLVMDPYSGTYYLASSTVFEASILSALLIY
ncbi:MAG: hypothetical protein AAF203_04645 [Pseudomonadota bacterium]